jgi:hypothetical protein
MASRRATRKVSNWDAYIALAETDRTSDRFQDAGTYANTSGRRRSGTPTTRASRPTSESKA